jgi:hypothetical protein
LRVRYGYNANMPEICGAEKQSGEAMKRCQRTRYSVEETEALSIKNRQFYNNGGME